MRALLLAAALYFVLVWSMQRDASWLGIAVALALVVITGGLAFRAAWVRRRARRERRWEQALYQAPLRPRAIRELQARLRGLPPRAGKAQGERTRLSVLLAELQDAQHDYASAMATIDSVALDQLDAVDAGLVRHTRAVTHLRGGDARGALAALRGRGPTGDQELDVRLSLLEAYARLELGEPRRALEEARRVQAMSELDASVQAEAKVVQAAALDASGRRGEALLMLASLGADSLEPLAELGQPRARALAKEVLQTRLHDVAKQRGRLRSDGPASRRETDEAG